MINKKFTLTVLSLLLGFSSLVWAQVPSYVPTNGLVGWWPFNGNANDESGNGNTGTVFGATPTVDRFGFPNKAYKFNSGQDLICTNNNYYSPNTLSYSIWIKSINSGFLMGFNSGQCTHGGSWDRTVYIQDSMTFGYYTFNGFEYSHNINSNVINNAWNHLVTTMDSSGSRLYLNGLLISFDSSQTKGEDLTGWFRFGGLSPNDLNNTMIGSIDDAGIWNRALTQQEITDLYKSGSLGNRTHSSLGFSVSPNPVKNTVNIKCNARLSGSAYVLYDITDKSVLSGKISSENTTIELNTLSPGMYWISVGENNRESIKIIKE